MGDPVEDPSAYPEDSTAYRSDIVDLSSLTLADLPAGDQTALATALRRIMYDLETAQDPVAGFNSSV